MTFDERVAAYLETGKWDSAWGQLPADLVALRERLADDATSEPPPEGGLDAVLAAIARERGGTAAAFDGVPDDGEQVGVTPVAPVATRRNDSGRERRRGVAAWLGAAATIAIAVVAVIVVVRGAAPPDGHDFELAGTDLAPEASATGLVWPTPSGEWFELDVSGLPPAGPGEYYAGWVRGEDGVVSIGTFHARDDGTIHLWSGVPVADFPEVSITRQRVGEGLGSSGDVVLQGRVPD